MKLFTIHGKKFALLGLLSFALLISACSQSPTVIGNTSTPSTQKITPTATTAPSSSSSSSTPSSGNPSSSETVTYASVDITILSVEQKAAFSDDSSATGETVRINTKEANTTTDGVQLFYSDTMRLILPDQKSIAPVGEQITANISQAVVRNNWLDFSVGSEQDINKLILRIGTAAEYQMDVPLSANPDLSKYQAKTTTPGAKLQYVTAWTVTKVTASLSANGKQATAGHRYITLDLKTDNTTAEAFYPFPNDNFRLKGSTATQAPESSTLPGNIAANSTGTTGTVTFLMPETDNNLTLDFLAQASQKIAEASANIQI